MRTVQILQLLLFPGTYLVSQQPTSSGCWTLIEEGINKQKTCATALSLFILLQMG